MKRKMRDLIRGFKNLYHFFIPVWNFYWWDYAYTLDILYAALKQFPDNYEKYGAEIEKDRAKRIVRMRRAVELLKKIRDDEYYQEKVYEEGVRKEKEDWNEFWLILKKDLKGWWD